MKASALAALASAIAVLHGCHASLPSGLALFFETDCPAGWIEEPLSQGRLIVSVTDGSLGGFTVNSPLGDQEDRPHLHQTMANTSLAVKEVSALSGSDHTAAAQGPQSGANASEAAPSGLGFVQLRLCITTMTLPNVSLPLGGAAYFGPDTFSCPDGFASLDDSQGRVLIPSHATDITKSDAPPLGNQEDRPHSHPNDNGACAIQTQSTDFEGVGGCCNDGPSADGTYPVHVAAGPATSKLPYVQFLTCGSDNSTDGAEATLPDGALFFSTSELGCPDGWQVFQELGGRYPVALPSGGTAGAIFGGSGVNAQSPTGVPHVHQLQGSIATVPAGIELIHGCCADGYAESGTYDYSCATDDTQGVGIPYLMLPLCQRAPGSLRGARRSTLD
jgi:hypothetical protein